MTVAKVKLGEAADILSGYAFKSELFSDSEGMPLIRIRDVVRGFTETRYSGEFGDEFVVQNGEIVIGMDGNFNAAKWSGGRALLNQRVCKIKARESVLNENYLFHYLPNALKKIEDATPFVTVKHLSVKGIREIEIPIPPLPEQIRIAAILDQSDALRVKRREALAQLDSLTQSIFIKMFGGNKTEISIGRMLDDRVLLLHKDGNHGSMYPRADDFGTSGIPFLSAKCVTEEGLIDDELIERLRDEIANKLKIGWIQKGDVLLAHNASVGKVALYDGRFSKALIGTSLTAFRPNPTLLNSQFLAASLRSSAFQRQLQKNMGQTTRNQVPITAQRELKLPLPPIDAQLIFAQKLSVINKQRGLNQAALVELDCLFTSLQDSAFRGELV